MSNDAATCSASAQSSDASFWRIVRQSLRGEHHDYTTGSLNRAVLLLAVPMVLEMIMESLFAVVDVFWVSRLGKEAVAVIGLTESVMTLVYAVAIGISFAATAIVATSPTASAAAYARAPIRTQRRPYATEAASHIARKVAGQIPWK